MCDGSLEWHFLTLEIHRIVTQVKMYVGKMIDTPPNSVTVVLVLLC